MSNIHNQTVPYASTYHDFALPPLYIPTHRQLAGRRALDFFLAVARERERARCRRSLNRVTRKIPRASTYAHTSPLYIGASSSSSRRMSSRVRYKYYPPYLFARVVEVILVVLLRTLYEVREKERKWVTLELLVCKCQLNEVMCVHSGV